jgi:hypothetical protein
LRTLQVTVRESLGKNPGIHHAECLKTLALVPIHFHIAFGSEDRPGQGIALESLGKNPGIHLAECLKTLALVPIHFHIANGIDRSGLFSKENILKADSPSSSDA